MQAEQQSNCLSGNSNWERFGANLHKFTYENTECVHMDTVIQVIKLLYGYDYCLPHVLVSAKLKHKIHTVTFMEPFN